MNERLAFILDLCFAWIVGHVVYINLICNNACNINPGEWNFLMIGTNIIANLYKDIMSIFISDPVHVYKLPLFVNSSIRSARTWQQDGFQAVTIALLRLLVSLQKLLHLLHLQKALKLKASCRKCLYHIFEYLSFSANHT